MAQMVTNRLPIAALGAVLVLGACAAPDDALWPPPGDAPAAGAPAAAVVALPPPLEEGAAAEAPEAAPAGAPPRLGETDFRVEPPSPGPDTGTFVGGKVVQLRDDLRRLQESVSGENGDLQAIRQRTVANAQGYHARVAAIRSRLQVGATPGNPELVGDWNRAQAELEGVSADIGAMNALSNRVAADAAMSTYLLEATRAAFGLSGAIEEDHRQLEALEDDVNRTVVLIDRLLTELSDDIRRQSTYVANERGDLNVLALAIKNGEYLGPSLSSAARAAPAPAAPSMSSAAPDARTDPRRALVVIRFDRPDVDYQQALYTAVNGALQRQPEASFDLVAVSSTGDAARAALDANTARRNAQAVLRSLVDMGLPPDRVALSATTSPSGGNEVRLYVR